MSWALNQVPILGFGNGISNKSKESRWFKSHLNPRRIWYLISGYTELGKGKRRTRLHPVRNNWVGCDSSVWQREKKIRGYIIDVYKIMDRTNSMGWLLSLPVHGLVPIRWSCCSQTWNNRRGIFMQWVAVNSLPRWLEITEDDTDSRRAWRSTGKRDLQPTWVYKVDK